MVAKILLTLLALYIAFGLYLYLYQEKLIFPAHLAPKEINLPKEAKRLFFEGLEVGILDRKSDTTLFYFGGNAENALEILTLFKALPFNIVTFNYPGYGKSQGRPSQEAILKSALKIFDKFKTAHNFIVGRSLGSSVAAFVGSKKDVDKIILITPFYSITHLAKIRYPIYPVTLLVRHPFPTYRYVQKIKAPILILRASDDKVTPPLTLHKLLEVIPKAKVITISNTTHQNILESPNFIQLSKEYLLYNL